MCVYFFFVAHSQSFLFGVDSFQLLPCGVRGYRWLFIGPFSMEIRKLTQETNQIKLKAGKKWDFMSIFHLIFGQIWDLAINTFLAHHTEGFEGLGRYSTTTHIVLSFPDNCWRSLHLMCNNFICWTNCFLSILIRAIYIQWNQFTGSMIMNEYWSVIVSKRSDIRKLDEKTIPQNITFKMWL